MAPADSIAAGRSPGSFLPSLPKRESASLREEIAALERQPIVHEDPLVKRWRSFERDVQRAQTAGPFTDDVLRQTEDTLRGFTLCSWQGRKGRCAFEDGKCRHCGRIESAFRQSYSIQAWREQEQQLWEEQKQRDQAEMNAKFQRQQEMLQAQWDELNAAKLNFSFEREQVMAMVQREREAVRQSQRTVDEQRLEVQRWREENAAELQAGKDALQEEQLKAEEEAAARWQRLVEFDQNCQAALLKFEEEKQAWNAERAAILHDLELHRQRLSCEQETLQQDREELHRQVAAFEALKQQHGELLQGFRVNCEQWVEEERETLQQQRCQEQRLLFAHREAFNNMHLRELDEARRSARQMAAPDAAYVPEGRDPSAPAARLLSVAPSNYTASLGPPFPTL
eukprot:GGOE01049458.1.p1 GENE.GGOE01049458.1~~GGOE01049458.1.p1  ORF type:complete len:415 (-),score=149.12 GGOE01049458.1:345-1535(-)